MPVSLFAALLGSVLAAPVAGQELIIIDGSFDDWSDASPALVDPADAPGGAIDFGAVSCKADGQFVHFLIALGREVNIQHLPGRGLIVIDADGDPRTGLTQFGLPGADVIVELTPLSARETGKPGMGIGLRSPTYYSDPADPTMTPLSPYDAGITFAPTYASDRTEIRIRRGVKLPNTSPLFEGVHFNGRLIALDASQQMRDETDAFTCALPPLAASRQIDQPTDPLARTPDANLRIMNWNSEFGAIFKQPEVYARILKAIEPLVIHFEEMPGERTGSDLEDLLNRIAMPENSAVRWHAIMGEGGADLRCAIASLSDLKPVESLRFVAYPDHPDRAVRVCGTAMENQGKRVLLVAVHLKCCGFAGSSEDQLRIREVELIRAAIGKAMEAQRFDGVIVSGDFNLVGSRRPLDDLAKGAGGGAAALNVLNPMQIDGRSNGTWADRKQPFAPGRLDYMLFGGTALKPLRSFVFDSTDLSEMWLKRHAMMPEDSEAASDHLPVVADFALATDGQ